MPGAFESGGNRSSEIQSGQQGVASIQGNFFAQRLAVAPAKWKLEFKKDVIAGCHERLVRFVFHHGPGP
jgi:hypothetical protein